MIHRYPFVFEQQSSTTITIFSLLIVFYRFIHVIIVYLLSLLSAQWQSMCEASKAIKNGKIKQK